MRTSVCSAEIRPGCYGRNRLAKEAKSKGEQDCFQHGRSPLLGGQDFQ
jgi:hypothetical protein